MGVAEAVGIGRELAIERGDFVAVVELGATDTIFVDFVGEIRASCDFETEMREKARRAREKADASDAVAAGFVHEGLDERAAGAAGFVFGCDGDRTDFGEVQAVEMERAAGDDAAVFFGDDKIADIFGDFGASARQERAGISVRLDDGADGFDVRQDGVAGKDHGIWRKNKYAETRMIIRFDDVSTNLKRGRFRRRDCGGQRRRMRDDEARIFAAGEAAQWLGASRRVFFAGLKPCASIGRDRRMPVAVSGLLRRGEIGGRQAALERRGG